MAYFFAGGESSLFDMDSTDLSADDEKELTDIICKYEESLKKQKPKMIILETDKRTTKFYKNEKSQEE